MPGPLTAHELAASLLKLPDLPVHYPGLPDDLPVEALFIVDDHIVLATEDERIGMPRQPPVKITTEGELTSRLSDATQKGNALLMLVHECYALIAAARPRHWLVMGASVEAVDWVRRAETLVRVIEEIGVVPPNKPIPLFECQSDECGTVSMYDQLDDRVPIGTSWKSFEEPPPPGNCPKCGTPAKRVTAAAGMAAELKRVLGGLKSSPG